MSTVFIEFEPLPYVVHSLPLNIRWQVNGPAEGTIRMILASLRQGSATIPFTGSSIVDVEINRRATIIPPISIDPGLYTIAAVNWTNPNHILAASHSFHFLPDSDNSAINAVGFVSHTNDTALLPSTACDISTSSLIVTPHLDVKLGAIIGLGIVMCLLIAVILFLVLWKVFPRLRGKNCLGDTHAQKGVHLPQGVASPYHIPLVHSSSPAASIRSKLSRETLENRCYTLSSSSSDTPTSTRAPRSTISMSFGPNLAPPSLETDCTPSTPCTDSVARGLAGPSTISNRIPLNRQLPPTPCAQRSPDFPPPEYSLGAQPLPE